MNIQGLKRVFQAKDKIIIHPYGGFTTRSKVYALGRVLEDEGIRQGQSADVFTTLWNSYKRFETDENPDMKVIVRSRGQSIELQSDTEGYVHVNASLPVKKSASGSEKIEYELASGQSGGFRIEDTLIPLSEKAEYGIISDIDDTILQTGVSSVLKWKLLVNSLLTRSDRRRTFEGGARLYRAFEAGYNQTGKNPFFYVSNSPWNMYHYIEAFLMRHTYPEGVILLRDFGRGSLYENGYQASGKKQRIEFLLKSIPELPFVMIGDAGEEDTDIYLTLLSEYPDRVKAILIRQVSNHRRNRRVEGLIREYSGKLSASIPVIMFRRAEAAFSFCRDMDLIH